MAQQRSTFAKLQREREKKEKAVAKAGRRAEKAAAAAEAGEPSTAAPSRDNEASILAALAELHAAFENGSVSSDEFEDRRDQLRQQLQVG